MCRGAQYAWLIPHVSRPQTFITTLCTRLILFTESRSSALTVRRLARLTSCKGMPVIGRVANNSLNDISCSPVRGLKSLISFESYLKGDHCEPNARLMQNHKTKKLRIILRTAYSKGPCNERSGTFRFFKGMNALTSCPHALRQYTGGSRTAPGLRDSVPAHNSCPNLAKIF